MGKFMFKESYVLHLVIESTMWFILTFFTKEASLQRGLFLLSLVNNQADVLWGDSLFLNSLLFRQ